MQIQAGIRQQLIIQNRLLKQSPIAWGRQIYQGNMILKNQLV